METHSHEINVGIDVGKSQLDAYVFEHQLALSCDNTPDGVHSLLVQLRRLAVTRIVIEASGRYERLFVDAALDQALPIVVNPLLVRRFAGALGQLAKTDAIDAKVIAHYAAALKPQVRPAGDKNSQRIVTVHFPPFFPATRSSGKTLLRST